MLTPSLVVDTPKDQTQDWDDHVNARSTGIPAYLALQLNNVTLYHGHYRSSDKRLLTDHQQPWTHCFFDYFHFITALHVMQTWYSDENSVCLSVCHTRDPWQNGRKICPNLYTKRKNIYPSFLRRIMVGGGALFYLKFWVNRPPLERNRRFSTNNRS